MDLPRIARETSQMLVNYLSYQALLTVLDQLAETNPSAALQLRQFAASQNLQESDRLVDALMAADPEMALRLMTVREHLAEALLDYLPQMVLARVQEANLEQKRHLLERLTQGG